MTQPSYLRRLRILAGLSLSKAADVVGMSSSQLSMAERGARTLPEVHLARLAGLYAVEPDVIAVAGGRVPRWMRERLRQNPAEATRAALDGFARYSPPEGGQQEEEPDA